MASSVRFLQCAGCRFDSPSWDGPEGWATQRNRDLWQTFEAVISLCRVEKVEFLFLTGDLFELDYVHKETVERVAKSLGRLKDTKIFITPGARDPFVTTSAYRLAVWPSNVHIFSSGINSVEIPAQNVTIYGSGWTAYHQDGPFLDGFQLNQAGKISIMLLHAEVEPNNTVGFIPILPDHIAASGLTYLALGHRVGWSGIQKAGETIWADCGFLEARAFGETGPHGVIIGEIEQDQVRLEFRELGQRQYKEKTVVSQDDIESVATELLTETSPEERQKDLYRFKLSGAFQSVEALQKLLEDKFRFVEVVHCEAEINPQTKAYVDKTLKARAVGYPTLRQVFSNKMKNRQATAESTQNHNHWELVKKIGLAALGQGRIDDED